MSIQQIERQIETERRNLTDLEAALGTANGAAERLESEAQKDLAGADLAQLEELALLQSQAQLEAAAQRRVAAELTRRADAQRRKVAQLEQELKTLQLADLQRDMDRMAGTFAERLEALLPHCEQMRDIAHSASLLGRSIHCALPPGWITGEKFEFVIEQTRKDLQWRLSQAAPAAPAPSAPVQQQVAQQVKRTAKRLVPAFMAEDDDDGDWTATAPGM
jgi:hypothetical protein